MTLLLTIGAISFCFPTSISYRASLVASSELCPTYIRTSPITILWLCLELNWCLSHSNSSSVPLFSWSSFPLKIQYYQLWKTQNVDGFRHSSWRNFIYYCQLRYWPKVLQSHRNPFHNCANWNGNPGHRCSCCNGQVDRIKIPDKHNYRLLSSRRYTDRWTDSTETYFYLVRKVSKSFPSDHVSTDSYLSFWDHYTVAFILHSF